MDFFYFSDICTGYKIHYSTKYKQHNIYPVLSYLVNEITSGNQWILWMYLQTTHDMDNAVGTIISNMQPLRKASFNRKWAWSITCMDMHHKLDGNHGYWSHMSTYLRRAEHHRFTLYAKSPDLSYHLTQITPLHTHTHGLCGNDWT